MRKIVILLIVVLLFIALSRIFVSFDVMSQPKTSVARHYITLNAREQGVPNIVTGIVVGYRALDTMGELVVLFAAALAIKLLLNGLAFGASSAKGILFDEPSPILRTAARVITPFIFLFGVYIIIHGHLSPGGGFQGGAIFATGILLMLLCCGARQLSFLKYFEGGAGTIIMLLAIGGAMVTGFYLVDYLPEGEFGSLISGGLLTVFYILIGIKVAAELGSIVNDFMGEK